MTIHTWYILYLNLFVKKEHRKGWSKECTKYDRWKKIDIFVFFLFINKRKVNHTGYVNQLILLRLRCNYFNIFVFFFRQVLHCISFRFEFHSSPSLECRLDPALKYLYRNSVTTLVDPLGQFECRLLLDFSSYSCAS